MDGDAEDFNLHWEEEIEVKHVVSEEVICGVEHEAYGNMQGDHITQDSDQMAAENLMFLAQDVVGYTDNAEITDDANIECVTEEVVTDDWTGGQDRVEVPIEQLAPNPILDIAEENENEVLLPTDQDEYTAMRPWPCDFCSRRFRKKAALMNHMVAHQNDRPHACNLCGVRYVRKCDLMNHLKVHAFVPDNQDGVDYEDMLENNQIVKPKKKRGRRKKQPAPVEDEEMWENMTSARTQQWSRRARSPAGAPAERREPREPTPPAPEPADPARPFVCRHCGIGFAREKALQSHSRVHGGDSPIECNACGELCWSREALAAHARHKHPHLPNSTPKLEPDDFDDSNSSDDMDFRLSPLAESVCSSRGSRGGNAGEARPPDTFCQDCGVAFQRADLLRRHRAAAHSYKRQDSGSSPREHVCSVCGEACPDALTLLAHAHTHAHTHAHAHPHAHARHATNNSIKKTRGRNNTSTSSNSRQFPCRECGKVFGSRSSQQIHIRIHTGERPYACRFCWKAFADGGTLRKHERIHTGEKPYACAVCPRAFNQRVVLREHVRSHHSAPDRRANGGPSYACVVCSRTLHSSSELVQHLIQHCDANTALKRKPQSGPRKYKRRKRRDDEQLATESGWESAASPPPRRRRPPPRPRPRMIHTQPATQVRTRRGARAQMEVVADRSRSPSQSPQPAVSADEPADEAGPYKCEMCSLEFPRRDALLLHVPIHI